jgi:hypothetical protein
MARRTKVIDILTEDSRDAGKSFLLTEMDAESAEWWAFRILQAAMASDATIDFKAPLAQMAREGLGAIAKMSSGQAKPLLDEMMKCVRIQLPSNGGSRELLASDIEEVGTRLKLRSEILELHTGFFALGAA